ncbi:class I SAM-dependent methyltransferase [Merismopedia glauca]|nr:class I SAM-dependent methyltransferase [Merismopedia glauca]
MSAANFNAYRQELLANASGDVLEIGFGTGLNLSYYPESIHQLIAIDANPGVLPLAQKRIQSSQINVEQQLLNGEKLPMPDNTFDTVVSTWTLCSIAKVEKAIQEIYRVLKPGGKFLFIEHGLASEPGIRVWQNRLTPFQKIVGDGCHLNRNIKQLLENQFESVTLQEFYAENVPKVLGYFYQGIATKCS